MNMQLFITFCVLNVVNVIIQTIRSIATIKCGKTMAAIANAAAYGLYTVVVVYMVCDLPLLLKVAIVAISNLLGVYVVKFLEEKSRKDKLWKVEATIETLAAYRELKNSGISCNWMTTSDARYIVNCFCKTQAESAIVKKILEQYNAKYFVTETKIL